MSRQSSGLGFITVVPKALVGENEQRTVESYPTVTADAAYCGCGPLSCAWLFCSYASKWAPLSAYSLLSLLSLFSMLSLGSIFSIMSVGSVLSFASSTSLASAGSVNSILSLLSMNSVLSIGCNGEYMKICLNMTES